MRKYIICAKEYLLLTLFILNIKKNVKDIEGIQIKLFYASIHAFNITHLLLLMFNCV